MARVIENTRQRTPLARLIRSHTVRDYQRAKIPEDLWRGLATRSDKLAVTYRAATVPQRRDRLTRHLSDMP